MKNQLAKTAARLIAAATLAATAILNAQAVPTLILSDGTNTATVVDNGPGDANPAVGSVLFLGNIGTWSFNVTSGITKPASGSVLQPYMDMLANTSSTAPGTLTIQFSEDFFGPATGPVTAAVGGNLNGGPGSSLKYSTFVSGTNTKFAGSPLTAELAFTETPYNGTASGSLAFPASFALTQKLVVTHTAAGTSGADASLSFDGPSGAIGDFVWKDTNQNGIQEPGEAGIDGVTVTLKNSSDAVIATTTTATNGFYQFTGLSAGTYVVTVNTASPALSGLVASPVAAAGSMPENDSNPNPATVVLVTDASIDYTIDFGYYLPPPPAPTGQIGNFVWLDLNQNGIQNVGEAGINGVKVTLKDGANNVLAMTTTAGNGAYLFSGLTAGTYAVEVDTSSPALAGFIATTPNAAGSSTGNDSNLNPSIVVLPTSTSVDLTIDFGYIPAPAGSIGDYVWKDLNGDGIQGSEADEPGIPNVTVRLYGPGNTLLATTTTDSDGLYLFTGLKAGTYTVVVDNSSAALIGWTPTTTNAPGSTTANDSNPNPTTVVLPLNTSSDTSVDFGYVPVPTGKIGNFVWKDLNANGRQDAGEPGINGVLVTLKDSSGMVLATTTTSGNGGYLFTGLSAGQYTVAVNEADTDLAGLIRTIVNAPGSTPANDSNPNPAFVTLATNSSEDLTIDFGFIPPGCGCIGNRVWKDLDCDGLQDCNEPGIKGVTVKLYWYGILINTTVTDCYGYYRFCGLWAGTYSVFIDNNQTALSGLVPTLVNAGTNRACDSNANPATVTLATNKSCDSSIDFGYKRAVVACPLITCTMAGWGAAPSGYNCAYYLAKYFSTVYPQGCTIGGRFYLKFTCAKGFENFLPCGGTAGALRCNYVNPSTSLGVLAGQCTALRLNVDFSNAGISGCGLVKLKCKYGKFAGWTVGQVLSLAESTLGGACLPRGISYSDISDICAQINENYADGANLGRLIP